MTQPDASPSARLDNVVLADRFVKALAFAIGAHGQQVRKGTEVTYVSHLLGVAGLVLEFGGDEDLAVAGLLHDAVEDTADHNGPAMAATIRSTFGDRVASVVNACSDTDVHPKPPWRPRKEAYLAHLATATREVLLVSCCDKLHNARTTVIELHEKGPDFWERAEGAERFNAKAPDQVWYYLELSRVFSERLGADGVLAPLASELSRTVDTIARLAAGATGPSGR